MIFPASQLCPVAGTFFCSVNTLLQTEQWLPSVSPSFSHVAATASSFTSLCPSALMASVFVVLQLVHVYVFTPASSQVASFVIFPASQLCPVAGISFLLFSFILLHLIQWKLSLPAFVQPASSSITYSPPHECSITGLKTSLSFVALHTLQWMDFLPFIHVGSMSILLLFSQSWTTKILHFANSPFAV